MAQRLRWRAGDESRGSFCSFTAASIFSSKLVDWLLTVFFSASRRAANFFASFARLVSRLTIEVFAIVLVLSGSVAEREAEGFEQRLGFFVGLGGGGDGDI